jgi:hypothetical protein
MLTLVDEVAVATTFVGADCAPHWVVTMAWFTIAQPFAFVTVAVSVTLPAAGVKVMELVFVEPGMLPPVICQPNVADPFAGTEAVCPAAQGRLLPTVMVEFRPEVPAWRAPSMMGISSSVALEQ